ncbi:zinc-dependent alcohol dehydrogenase [Bryobacterales bacterium F-183]|nr:zinc-dependent alcohol dehydrogenase [Bryobacterales bacterium F-183]
MIPVAGKMQAAVVREFGRPLQIESIPVPIPGRHEILLETEACGVCHTDLHAADGDWPIKPNLPFVPGHEGVGRVIGIGEDVGNFAIGDRAGLPWLYNACGTCEYCTTGWETLCPTAQYGGYTVNGGFAQYMVVDARYAPHIPDALSSVQAAPLLCAGVTTYKGLKETEARPGQWVVISGIGGLGHLAIQYAKAMGLEVAAVDVREEKLTLAREVGASITINAAIHDPVKVIQHEIGGAHGVLITAPSTPAFQQAVGMTRRKGTCVLVGLPPGDFPLPIFDVVLKRLTIRGSLVGTRNDMEEALALAAKHGISAHFETAALDDINRVFEQLRYGKVQGRVVLDMNRNELELAGCTAIADATLLRRF